MPSVEASVPIRCRIDDVFDFLARSESIEKIVPAELKLRLVKSPQRLELGSQFEVEILGFGIPQKVVYEVTEFARPSRIVERQIKGPLGRYVHEHLFAEQADGTVLVTDRIDFDPPGGFLGLMITAESLRKSLAQGLEHRHRELKSRMEGS
jgi:ligand-binding SRPBCC domain-containing protein